MGKDDAPGRTDRGAGSLVARTGGLGDLVLLHPALEALHERDGIPPVLVTSSSLVPEIYRHCPHVGEVHVVRAKRVPRVFNRSWWAVRRLARAAPRTLYLLDRDPRTAGFYRRLEERAGEVVSWRDVPGREAGEHESAYALRLIGASAVEPEQARPVLPVTTGEMEAAGRWLAGLGVTADRRVLLQAGNKATMKRGPADRAANRKHWAEERWVEVVDAATQSADAVVLLCGSPEEAGWLEGIRTRCRHPDRVRTVAADLPIRRFMALSRMAGSCYLGVDTGPAHVAAAMGCPCVILFGPARTANFRPLSWGQRLALLEKAEAPGGEPRIGLLSPAEVIEALAPLLREGALPEDPDWESATLVASGGGLQ